MKIGGYVKADFIYDFDPIDCTDSIRHDLDPGRRATAYELTVPRAGNTA